MADDIDEFEFVTVIRKREEEPLKINGVVYSIIGLVATSVYNFISLYTPTRNDKREIIHLRFLTNWNELNV